MIGPKTATRLTFWLLEKPDDRISELMDVLEMLRDNVEICNNCFAFTRKGEQPCRICSSTDREPILCVVETQLDVFQMENSGAFKGYYHVLQGLISPLNGVTPEQLRIKELLDRLMTGRYEELLLALPPTLEGDMTSMYIAEKVKELNEDILVTRLGFGLPVGANLDYTDSLTLLKALENRKPFKPEEFS